MPVRPALTPALRQKLGIPATKTRPYPWLLALLLVVLAAGPLWMAGYPKLMGVVLAVGFVILPGVRWLEGHERAQRERLYRQGREALAVIVEVEPAGDRRDDHRVRLDILLPDDSTRRATVVGSPLARQGLGPGDEVKVVYDERDPRRCLILGRARRQIIDAVFADDSTEELPS